MIDFNKINLNRLYYFYYVATCKNITRGAIEANLHQSSMTRQMMALEREIGTKLFKRHYEGVSLTRAGEEVFGYAERIAIEVGAIRKQLDEIDKISGKIRICTTYTIANYILGEHLIEFSTLYPDIHLDIICNDYTLDLVKNDVDVAIRPYDSENSNIIQDPIFKLQAKLYASPEYIEKNGFPKTAEELSNHKFVAWSRMSHLPFNVSLDWFLKIDGCTTQKNCVMNVNSIEMLLKAAQKGKGIISLYDNMDIIHKSGLIPVAPKLSGDGEQDYFVYSKQMKDCRRIETLKEYLKSKFKH